jgi:hypothetical protein
VISTWRVVVNVLDSFRSAAQRLLCKCSPFEVDVDHVKDSDQDNTGCKQHSNESGIEVVNSLVDLTGPVIKKVMLDTLNFTNHPADIVHQLFSFQRRIESYSGLKSMLISHINGLLYECQFQIY